MVCGPGGERTTVQTDGCSRSRAVGRSGGQAGGGQAAQRADTLGVCSHQSVMPHRMHTSVVQQTFVVVFLGGLRCWCSRIPWRRINMQRWSFYYNGGGNRPTPASQISPPQLPGTHVLPPLCSCAPSKARQHLSDLSVTYGSSIV
jgi:hypothetical protein